MYYTMFLVVKIGKKIWKQFFLNGAAWQPPGSTWFTYKPFVVVGNPWL
jgi:hypothetical protein